MQTPSDLGPLRDYLSRLTPDVSHITLTAEMVQTLTGRPLRSDDWTPGAAIDGWEVVEVIPKVGLALSRSD